MINTLTTLRAHLLTFDDLTAITGQRIWAGGAFPPQGYTPEAGPGIVFNGRGGLGLNTNSRLLYESFQFKCYAASVLAALALYGTLVDVLHDSSAQGIRIALLETTGQPLREPDPLGWPFVLAFFQVIFDSQLGE